MDVGSARQIKAGGVGELGLSGAMGVLWVAVNQRCAAAAWCHDCAPAVHPEHILEAIASAAERASIAPSS